jgi:hypothetical protein
MNVVTLSPRQALIPAVLLIVACGGHRANLAPSPATPDQTVERFLAAVNGSDLEGMAMLWGTKDGPEGVTHTMSEAVRIQRLTIMQHMLKSDNHLITATDATDPGKRVLTVAMTQNNRRFAVPFTLIPSRAGGWLIREIGLDAAMPDAGGRPNQ